MSPTPRYLQMLANAVRGWFNSVMTTEQQDGSRAYTEERLEWTRANAIDER